jgi:hypothetical protein
LEIKNISRGDEKIFKCEMKLFQRADEKIFKVEMKLFQPNPSFSRISTW